VLRNALEREVPQSNLRSITYARRDLSIVAFLSVALEGHLADPAVAVLDAVRRPEIARAISGPGRDWKRHRKYTLRSVSPPRLSRASGWPAPGYLVRGRHIL